MSRYRKPNRNKRLAGRKTIAGLNLEDLARRVQYTGNPLHKRNPGDFGLNPSAQGRQGKSLCDRTGIVTRKTALRYLRQGIRAGAVCERMIDGWPRHVWAVTSDGVLLEAVHDGAGRDSYHGYPVKLDGLLTEEIKKLWGRVT